MDDLSAFEKWGVGIVLAAGALGASTARLVWSSHPLGAIVILCVSILLFLLGFWVGARPWIKRRTLFAAILAVTNIAVSGWWLADERHRLQSVVQLPSPTPSVEQTVTGDGNAVVNGSGNKVNVNPPPAKTGDKQ